MISLVLVVEKNLRRHNWKNLTKKKNGSNIYKGMTSPLTQNLKIIRL